MNKRKEDLIARNLLFWLGGGTITDPDRVLAQVALDTDSTKEEVWEVYTKMVEAVIRSA